MAVWSRECSALLADGTSAGISARPFARGRAGLLAGSEAEADEDEDEDDDDPSDSLLR